MYYFLVARLCGTNHKNKGNLTTNMAAILKIAFHMITHRHFKYDEAPCYCQINGKEYSHATMVRH